MKRLKKVLMPFLVFGTIVLVASCNNEEIDTSQLTSQNAKINQAKDWFENYKSNSTTNKSEEGEFNKAFRNLDYYWENAKVIQLSENSTGITVPIKDNPEDPDYKGQKMLYLYESNSKYQALIQEIFPESQDKIDDTQKKQGFEDLTFFSGYIIHWDLKKGFLKGAKLKEGLVIEDVQDVIMLFDKDHKHSSTSKMIEMFDESANYGGERDDTLQRGGTAAIPLNNVIVTQKSPAPAPRDFSIAGAFGGDGGSSGNSSTPTGGGGAGRDTEGNYITSQTQLVALIKSTDPNAYDFRFVQNGNSISTYATIGLLPWLNISLEIIQNKINNQYVISKVATNLSGMTVGATWSQTSYSQTTSGNITTVILNGVVSYSMPLQSLGTVYTYNCSYSVQIDKTSGKIISGKRIN